MTWGDQRQTQACITATTVLLSLLRRHCRQIQCRVCITFPKKEGTVLASFLDASDPPLGDAAAAVDNAYNIFAHSNPTLPSSLNSNDIYPTRHYTSL